MVEEKKEEVEKDKKEEDGDVKEGKNVGMAALCYFGILVLIPLLTDAKKDPYVKFHIKQGLVLLVAGIANSIISMIPFLGWVIGFIVWIMLLVFFVIGLINALTGKEKELPLIGKYGEKITI